MKKKIFEKYEEIMDNYYDNMSDEDIIREQYGNGYSSSGCCTNLELFEAYSSLLIEKLKGDIENKEFSDNGGYYGGVYKGKKFSAGYSTQNFGKQIENKDELEMNQKYNIYVEHHDMWLMGYRLKAAGIGMYRFKYDNKSETEKFNIKRLYNNIKKGYIISYSN